MRVGGFGADLLALQPSRPLARRIGSRISPRPEPPFHRHVFEPLVLPLYHVYCDHARPSLVLGDAAQSWIPASLRGRRGLGFFRRKCLGTRAAARGTHAAARHAGPRAHGGRVKARERKSERERARESERARARAPRACARACIECTRCTADKLQMIDGRSPPPPPPPHTRAGSLRGPVAAC